jgi:DNA-binding NarL/FixJ family response regulator
VYFGREEIMLRILVADDHEIVKRGLRALLESKPEWTVVAEASNGREAVEQADRHKPNVAVLDISMPELGG